MSHPYSPVQAGLRAAQLGSKRNHERAIGVDGECVRERPTTVQQSVKRKWAPQKSKKLDLELPHGSEATDGQLIESSGL